MKSKKNGTYPLLFSPVSTWKGNMEINYQQQLNNVNVLLEDQRLFLNEK